MLDPITIATSCVSLINGITSLTMHITVFVNDVRGARKDMDLISRELTSLSLCLGALRTDCQSHRVYYPEASRKGIERALLNIDVLTQQIKDLLQKLSSGKLGRRIQWTIQSKDTVDRLRSSLETQKSTIEIALQCGSIQILCAIQRQVEKPAQDLTHLTNSTRAIREDAEALRKDAVDIKQLIRQEADALRTEISAMKHGKKISTETQDFLRLSQDYSNLIADPFMTPEQSDTGLDESPVEASSRPSIDSTLGPLIGGVESLQVLEQVQNLGVVCLSCGHRMASNSLQAELQAKTNSSNSSALRGILRKEAPSTGFNHVQVPLNDSVCAVTSSDDSITHVTVRCGKHEFNTTFSKLTEFSIILVWFFSILKQAEENRVFWIPEIIKTGDIRFSLDGTELITYPGETISDLAQLYGFGGVLQLDAVSTPQPIPDFRKNLKIMPDSRIRAYQKPTRLTPSFDFDLKNDNDARWHAPIAWYLTYTGHGDYLKKDGGVIPSKGSTGISLRAKVPNFEFQVGDKLILQACLMKSEFNPEHWKRLLLMTPETEKWKSVLTYCEDGCFSRPLNRNPPSLLLRGRAVNQVSEARLKSKNSPQGLVSYPTDVRDL